MASPSDHVAKTPPDRNALLRQIPSVEELLNRPALAGSIARAGRGLAVRCARQVLRALREAVSSGAPSRVEVAEIEGQIAAEIERELKPSLRSVINATGVILHTNLGRAPLARRAAEQLLAAATRYCNLEYDLAGGARGKRDVHTARWLAELVGAEAAIVVNNNAAAVFLVLHTLAKGAEAIVSRGELIEIGDGFRIPDILKESGAELREVGTTNRTRLTDYERAITDRTRLLLRVHPSNFRITGFTEKPGLQELVALGKRLGIPVAEDLGSGCLADLRAAGVEEPLARASVEAGVDMVTFSGDKLFGGPQAGIIAGKKVFVDKIRRNPLFRALRVDKLTISALEMTLEAYRRGALDEIPALRMIRMGAGEAERRAKAFLRKCEGELPKNARLQIRAGFSVIGGGSAPDQNLPTHLVCVTGSRYPAAELEERLRSSATGPPVIARIEEDCVVLDLRTVFPEEESELAAALLAALR